MPITIVDVTTTSFNNLSSWSCDVSPLVQDGDYLISVTTNAQSGRTFSAHASWTKLSGQTGQNANDEWVDGTGTDSNAAVQVRVASSEPASYTFTGSGGMFGTQAILVLRGVDTAAALAACAGQGTASGTTHVTPSITPPVTGCLLVGTWGQDFTGAASWTSDMNVAAEWDFSEPSVFQNSCGFTETYNSTSPVSRTGTSTATDSGIAILLAIRPAAGGSTTYSQSVSGGLTPSGTLRRQTGKVLLGAITPSGSVAAVRTRLQSLIGTLTTSGTVSGIRTRLRSLSGALTPAGTVVRRTSKRPGGTLQPSGALLRRTNKRLLGGLTPAGSLASARVRLRAVAGTLSFAGTLTSILTAYVPAVTHGIWSAVSRAVNVRSAIGRAINHYQATGRRG